MTNFEEALQYTLENEGGYVANISDPGGSTSFGISQRSYPELNIETLTLEQATLIYKRDYWNKIGLQDVKQNFATALFDMCVNMGEGHAILCAQMALGQKSPDGILGDVTKGLLEHVDSFEFLYAYIGEVHDYYCNIVMKNPKQIVFLKGWIRRATRLMTLIA